MRKSLIVLFILNFIFLQQIFSQNPFAEKQSIFEVDVVRPEILKSGDFDKDGDLDLIVASSESDKILLFKNDDIYNIWNHTLIDSIDVRDIAIIDMNNDSHLDILVIALYKIVWYENDGLGNFITEHLVSQPEFSCYRGKIEAADLDDDNDVDFVVIQDINDRVAWYRNNNGIFSEPIYLEPSQLFNGIHLTDINLDGKLDLIISYDGSVTYKLNLGDGSFEENGGSIGSISGTITDIISKDIDSDGDYDIVVGAEGYQTTKVFFNNGDLTFSASTIAEEEKTTSVICEKIDNDEKPDIIASLNFFKNISWFKNQGSSTFGNLNTISDFTYGYKQEIIGIDIDNDNDIDIASASSFDNKVVWFENNGNGEFNNVHYISNTVSSYFFFPKTLYNYDLDNDGFEDLYVTSVYEERIATLKNNNSIFDSPKSAVWVDASEKMAVDDIDKDGLKDYVVTSYNSNSNVTYQGIRYFKNNGNSESTLIQTIENESSVFYNDLQFSDLNSDGKNDLITIDNQKKLKCFLVNSSNLFELPIILNESSNNHNSLNIIDIDDDIDVDILYGEQNDNKIFIQSNDSEGNFTAKTEFLATNYDRFTFFKIIDFNQNGNLDIITLGTISNNWFLDIYMNDGSGNYTYANLIDYGTDQPNDVKIIDINLDGHLDFGAKTYNSILGQEISWFIDDGDQNYTKEVTININDLTNYSLSDFDNDGDQDMFVIPRKSYNIFLYLNESEDTQAPIANCFDTVTVYLNQEGNILISSNLINNNSVDNNYIDTIYLNQTLFGCDNIGTQTITLTVEDAEGLSNSCTTILNVRDTISPSIECKDTTIILADESATFTFEQSEIQSLANDNCQINSVALNQAIFDINDIGINQVTLTSDDVNGNTSSCKFNVEILLATNVFDQTSQEISFYPNPFSRQLNIEINEPSDYDLKLVSVQGKIVYEKLNVSDKTFTLDGENLANGFYILNIYKSGTEQLIKRIKLIVE